MNFFVNSMNISLKMIISLKSYLLEELKHMSNVSAELKRLQNELDESQSQHTVTKLEMEGRFEEQTRKYNEEISSLHKVLNGNNC